MAKIKQKADIQIDTLDLKGNSGVVDLRCFLVNMVIFEDIFKPFTHTEIHVIDVESLTEVLPITGDEEIILSFKSSKDGEYRTYTKTFKIVRVDNLSNTGEGQQKVYRILASTPIAHKNLTRVISRSYPMMREDEIVSDIVQNVLGESVETEPAKFKRNFVVPSMRPLEVIEYLKSVAVRGSGYPAVNYLFFEDADGFKFVSFDKLIESGPAFTLDYKLTRFEYSYPAINTGYNNFETYNVSDKFVDWVFDAIQDTSNGLWRTKFIGHDLIKKSLKETDWKYESEWPGQKHLSNATDELRLKFPKDEFQRIIFGPFQERLEDYHNQFADQYRHKTMPMKQQLGHHILNCNIEGNTNILVGKCCTFNVPSESHRRKDVMDEQLNGDYIVTRIRHDLTRRNHTMSLELRRHGNGNVGGNLPDLQGC